MSGERSSCDSGPRLQVFVFAEGAFVREETFAQQRVSVGSAAEAALRLTGEGIAPLHALLELRDDAIVVTNLCEHGVQIAGREVDREQLQDDALLTVGPLSLKCKIRRASGVVAPKPAPAVAERPKPAPVVVAAPKPAPIVIAPPKPAPVAVAPVKAPPLVVAAPKPTPAVVAPAKAPPLVVTPPAVAEPADAEQAALWPVADDWDEGWDEDDLEDLAFEPSFSVSEALQTVSRRPGRASDRPMVEVVEVRGERIARHAILGTGQRFEAVLPDGARMTLVERAAQESASLTPPPGGQGVLTSELETVPLSGPSGLPMGALARVEVDDVVWSARWIRVPPPPKPKLGWRPSLVDVVAALVAVLVVFGAVRLVEHLNRERERDRRQGAGAALAEGEAFAEVDLKELALVDPEVPQPEAVETTPIPEEELSPPEPTAPQPPEPETPEVAAAPAPAPPDATPRGARKGRKNRRPGKGKTRAGKPGDGGKARGSFLDDLGQLGATGKTRGGGRGAGQVGDIDVTRSAGGGYRHSGPLGKRGGDALAGQGGSGRPGKPRVGKGMTFGGGRLGGKGGGEGGKGGSGGPGKLKSRKKRGKVKARVKKRAMRALKGQGTLSREAIAAVVNKHFSQIQKCYESVLMHDPKLKGKLTLEWTIQPSGGVTRVRAVSTSLANPKVVRCIQSKVRRWKFKKPSGGSVVVTYPFVFENAGAW